MPADLALDLHGLSAAWSNRTGPTVANDGTELAWSVMDSASKGSDGHVPDIAAFTPGVDSEPRIVYSHPDRDSLIWEVAVRDGQYAFLEFNSRLLGGENGWRLWALPAANAKAVLLDTRDGPPDDPRPGPSFVLTRDGIVWTAVHDRQGVPTYELRTARLDGSGNRALLTSPAKTLQYWYPSVDPSGTTIAYATVAHAGSGYAFRVWSLDLTAAPAVPTRLGDSDVATQPVANESHLAWRIADENVSNESSAMVLAGRDGSGATTVGVQRLTNLSIGNRFVGFDAIEHVRLELYDLQAQRLVTVERHAQPETLGFQPGWTRVAGDLLVFRRVDYFNADDPADSQIVWARLPAPAE